ncbi:FAD-dependent oxidoreductase [Candidatus Woesearchaeota archaeon]|nr:FAD-dependent oxidoreductase [Candidatus Woesearchaeota archaeon]
MDKVDVVIIGGGVCGLAAAYFYSKKFPKQEILLLEKNLYLGEEQSGRNSGVLHSGILNPKNSLKSELCSRGVEMLKSFAKAYNIPCETVGKITVATKKEELIKLDFYLKQAIANGAQDARIIDKKEINLLEPNVEALAAVYTPSTAIIDTASYIKTLTKSVKNNSVTISPSTRVENVTPNNSNFVLNIVQNGEELNLETKILINAAGLFSEEIARLINPEFPYKIKPLRGEFMKFNKKKRRDILMNGLAVYPLPSIMPGGVLDQYSKPRNVAGTHLIPTFDLLANGSYEVGSTVHVGPLSKETSDRSDYENNRSNSEEFVKQISFFPGLKSDDLELDYTGIQLKMEGYNDFVIEKDKKYQNAIHVLAESPGLSSSLAIGEYMVGLFRRR